MHLIRCPFKMKLDFKHFNIKFEKNTVIIAGAGPGNGVKADTKLIRDSTRNFMEQFNKSTLTVDFPKILQNLQGSDAQIEIIQSAML